LNLNERLAIAEFLCSESSDVVQFLDPSLFSHLEMRLDEKLAFLEKAYGFSISTIFPSVDKISKVVNVDRFLKSHFQQPNLFIRIHRGKESFVKAALKDNEIPFKEITHSTLSFQNGTQLDRIKPIQGKYEVQDLSSQKTAELFKPRANDDWWDACSGSGGKSIALK